MTTGKDAARLLAGRPERAVPEIMISQVVVDVLRDNILDEAQAAHDYPLQAQAINRFVARMAPGDPRRDRMIHLVNSLQRIAREEKEHLRIFMETLSLIDPPTWRGAEAEVTSKYGYL